MSDDNKSIIYLHSVDKKLHDGKVVVIRESIIDKTTGEITPSMRYIKNPMRSFYITKPEFRDHRFKKERCKIGELDEFTTYDHELTSRLREALGDFESKPTIDSLCKSPYVYGADIKIEALIKMNYLKRYGLDHLALTTGFFDIETSVVNGEIIIVTVTHETKVYTAIRRSYMYEEDKNGNMKSFTVDDVIVECQKELREHIDKHGFTFEYYVGETELDLIKWIMGKIFENKTDFIGVWNINFDIPRVLDSLRRANVNPLNVMVHPDIPREYRSLNYNEDKAVVHHYTLKWNWLYMTGYSQFVDSMGLYSQVRKTAKFENSYSLENILQVNLGIGKIKIPNADNHFIMQTKHFKKYIVYNQFDAIGIQLLEWKNEDMSTMMVQASETPVALFGYKSITTTNRMYRSSKEKGYIISSKSQEDPLRLIT